MPRRSAASYEVPRIDVARQFLAPPADLSPPAREVWDAVVLRLAPDHFAPSDAPLVRAYCEHAAMAARADAELATHGPVIDGKASLWLVVQEKSTRGLVALSARLRLCPQSRYSRDKAGSNTRRPGQPPWRSGYVPLHKRGGPEDVRPLEIDEYEDMEE